MKSPSTNNPEACGTCQDHHFVCTSSGKAPCQDAHKMPDGMDPRKFFPKHDWVPCQDCHDHPASKSNLEAARQINELSALDKIVERKGFKPIKDPLIAFGRLQTWCQKAGVNSLQFLQAWEKSFEDRIETIRDRHKSEIEELRKAIDEISVYDPVDFFDAKLADLRKDVNS